MESKVLIVPGLNLHPQQMQGLAQALPYDHHIMTLKGIDPNNKATTKVSFKDWLDSLEEHIANNEYSAFIGFSLGGLLLAHLAMKGALSRRPIVLLAPALKIHGTSWLPEKLFKLLPFPSLLSLQKEEFIVHRFTPKFLYLALYEGIRNLKTDWIELQNNPILCFLHQKDELVSSNKIQEKILTTSLPQTELHLINYPALLGKHLHHLCFHEKNLSNDDFEALIAQITRFLAKY